MKYVLLAAVLGLSALVPGLAHAQGHYAGVGAVRVEGPFNGTTKTAPKLFGGVDLNDKYGVEIGFIRVPTSTLTTSSAAAPVPFSTSRSVRSQTIYLAGKATVPLTDKFGFVARVGLAHTRNKMAMTVTPSTPAAGSQYSSSDTGLYASFGLTYRLTDKISLGVDLERNARPRFDNGKRESISISAGYRF